MKREIEVFNEITTNTFILDLAFQDKQIKPFMNS